MTHVATDHRVRGFIPLTKSESEDDLDSLIYFRASCIEAIETNGNGSIVYSSSMEIPVVEKPQDILLLIKDHA